MAREMSGHGAESMPRCAHFNIAARAQVGFDDETGPADSFLEELAEAVWEDQRENAPLEVVTGVWGVRRGEERFEAYTVTCGCDAGIGCGGLGKASLKAMMSVVKDGFSPAAMGMYTTVMISEDGETDIDAVEPEWAAVVSLADGRVAIRAERGVRVFRDALDMAAAVYLPWMAARGMMILQDDMELKAEGLTELNEEVRKN